MFPLATEAKAELEEKKNLSVPFNSNSDYDSNFLLTREYAKR